MYKIYIVRKKDISNCTYNMVDLGLPSGLKWADRNIGASSPEDFGSYFQWGDTDAYTFDGVGEVTAAQLASIFQPIVGGETEVTKDNVGDILLMLFSGHDVGTDLTNTPRGALGGSLKKFFKYESYFDTTDNGSTFNKYNNNGGLTVLDSSDDAATVHMGSQYRIPIYAEIQELIDNTTQIFIDLDGNEYSKEQAKNRVIASGRLKGVRFIGSNGNSIFIPAAGDCVEYLLYDIGTYSKLWSSSLYTEGTGMARLLYFKNDGSIGNMAVSRSDGYSIRGVQS